MVDQVAETPNAMPCHIVLIGVRIGSGVRARSGIRVGIRVRARVEYQVLSIAAPADTALMMKFTYGDGSRRGQSAAAVLHLGKSVPIMLLHWRP